MDEGKVTNLFRDHLSTELGCHGGEGSIEVFRPYLRTENSPWIDFIDLVVIPPGSSIGRHRHGDNVEWYVILEGRGEMWFQGKQLQVGPGDILVNPPWGEHGLDNRSDGSVKLLVFQLSKALHPDGH